MQHLTFTYLGIILTSVKSSGKGDPSQSVSSAFSSGNFPLVFSAPEREIKKPRGVKMFPRGLLVLLGVPTYSFWLIYLEHRHLLLHYFGLKDSGLPHPQHPAETG